MKTEIKYIYFERYRITGNGQTEFEIRNFNILLNKPENTGSSGINNCMNITERNGYMDKSYFVVDQYWIDLDKYKYDDKQLNKNIEYVLNELNKGSLSINGINHSVENKYYIPSDDIIIDYINSQLTNKIISLGYNRDIFNYNDIKIIDKNESIVIIDIIYTENNKDNMCKRFELSTNKFLKLPHFKLTDIIRLNPIYSSLFEIELSSNSNKIKLNEDIFKYDLTKNNIQLYFNIFEETDLNNLINILSKVDEIIVKQHDDCGKVFNNINISVKNINYDFKISQNYVDTNISTYLIFVLNDIEVCF